MPIPSSGVPQKKSKVYVDKGGESFLQIFPEIYCESEILPESYYPVSSFALAQWKELVDMALQPFSGATATAAGSPGTVPSARPEDRGSYLRGDGTWGKIEITDNKVRNVASNTTRFYITGTGQNSTNTGTQYFDTYVYVSENAGELVAKKFIGDLKGNVEGNLNGTATSAITDGNGNNIVSTYATKAELATAGQGHKHTSADVNKLTGYSKGTASTAIAATDTLNAALSKLEVRLDKAATLDSPAFTGTPTAPTPTKSGNAKQIANREYVDSAISSLVNGAGSALDTLGELARALNNDPNFASSITTALAGKLAANSAGYVKALSISDTTTGQNLTVQYGNNSTNVLAIKDTKYTPATAAPKAPASTAAVGTSVKYAREDHVHPLQTTISGKAETAGRADKADRLTTPRKLRANLAATADATFDGSVDQLNIPVAGVLPVANGGTGANTLNGLVQTGNVNQTIGGTKTFSNKITGSISGNAGSADVSAKTTGTPAGTTWVAGATSGKALVNSTATGFGAILNASTKNYKVAMSTYPSNTDLVYLYSVTNANVSSGTNTVAKSLTWNAADGTLTADSFKGTLVGNAQSATKATQDGDGKVISSTYLKLAGGTVTGPLNLTTTTDASGTGTTQPALRIGALTGAHLEFDGNEIMAKATGNTVGTLTINSDGGLVQIGSGGLKVAGTITGNLTGNVTGNVSGSSTSCTGNANTATTASKLGTANVGGNAVPIYLAAGVPKASTGTVGSASAPVYLKAGTITQCTGVATTAVYKGATASAAGVAGLVPAAAKNAHIRFLGSDATWRYINFDTPVNVTGSAVDLSRGTIFYKEFNSSSAATTFSFTNIPSGQAAIFNLIITNGGLKTVKWPSSVKWSEKTPPTLASSGVDVLTFITRNGGSTWYGTAAIVGA